MESVSWWLVQPDPGQKPSGLDHLYSNQPEKIALIKKYHAGGSDHMFILAVRTSKAMKSSP